MKHTAPEKKLSDRSSEAWGSSERGCTRARCSNSGSKDYADSKDKACDARPGARVVQIALCSASTSKNCEVTAPNS